MILNLLSDFLSFDHKIQEQLYHIPVKCQLLLDEISNPQCLFYGIFIKKNEHFPEKIRIFVL